MKVQVMAVLCAAAGGMMASEASSCFFDLAAECKEYSYQIPPDMKALVDEGMTCDLTPSCCSAIKVAVKKSAPNSTNPLKPEDVVGKCGRKDQVNLFDCEKAEYNKFAATPSGKQMLPPWPISEEPVADTSPDGVGTCNFALQGAELPISGVSPGCCGALNFAGVTGQSMTPDDAPKVIGKCGKKDQDSLLAFAKQMGVVPPQLQTVVEQATKAKAAAIELMRNMVHSASAQQSTRSSYQLGSIALFGGLGGFAGALFTLAIAKQFSKRVENRTPLLA
jgi:hypothetical protein